VPRTPAQFVRTASPEALYVLSGIAQYTGAVIAIRLFDEGLSPSTVAVFRVLLGAIPVLLVSWRGRKPWTREALKAAAIFGIVTALMNISFYNAAARLPLGKSVLIEFIGPIAIAAYYTRTRRNAAALALAVGGVVVLSGAEIGGDPLGLFFIFLASALWAAYIVLGRNVASLDRGLDGLGVGLVIGGLVTLPIGWTDAAEIVTTPRLLWLCFLVGLFSSAIGYGIDQIVLRRIPMRRFAVLLALLPVCAMVLGAVALDQTPTAVDAVGAVLVIAGVLVQEREELVSLPEELPGSV
jgi:inner membrane transporter RhtA